MTRTKTTTSIIADHEIPATDLLEQEQKPEGHCDASGTPPETGRAVMGIPTETFVYWLSETAPIYLGVFPIVLLKGCV